MAGTAHVQPSTGRLQAPNVQELAEPLDLFGRRPDQAGVRVALHRPGHEHIGEEPVLAEGVKSSIQLDVVQTRVLAIGFHRFAFLSPDRVQSGLRSRSSSQQQAYRAPAPPADDAWASGCATIIAVGHEVKLTTREWATYHNTVSQWEIERYLSVH